MAPMFQGGGGAGGPQVRQVEVRTKFTVDAAGVSAAMADMAARADRLAASVSKAEQQMRALGGGAAGPGGATAGGGGQAAAAAGKGWMADLNKKTDFLAGAAKFAAAVETVEGLGKVGLAVSRLGMEAGSARGRLLELQRAIPVIGEATASLNSMIFAIRDRVTEGGAMRSLAAERFTQGAALADIRGQGAVESFRQQTSLARADASRRSIAYGQRALDAAGMGMDILRPTGSGMAYDIAARSAGLGDDSAQRSLAAAERGLSRAQMDAGLAGQALSDASAQRATNDRALRDATLAANSASQRAASGAAGLMDFGRSALSGPAGRILGFGVGAGLDALATDSGIATSRAALEAARRNEGLRRAQALAAQGSQAEDDARRRLAEAEAAKRRAEAGLTQAQLGVVSAQESQARGGTRQFGAMAPDEQADLLAALRKAKEIGFDRLTPEEKQRLMGSGLTAGYAAKEAERAAQTGQAGDALREINALTGQQDLKTLEDERKKLEAKVAVQMEFDKAALEESTRKAVEASATKFGEVMAAALAAKFEALVRQAAEVAAQQRN